MTEIICVPLIVAAVYALIEVYKKTIAKTNQTLNRIIPIIGLILGASLGIICYFACPELIVAHSVLSAIIVGASSGLSATGCNQILKQLKKYGITVSEPNETDNKTADADAQTSENITPNEQTPTEKEAETEQIDEPEISAPDNKKQF